MFHYLVRLSLFTLITFKLIAEEEELFTSNLCVRQFQLFNLIEGASQILLCGFCQKKIGRLGATSTPLPSFRKVTLPLCHFDHKKISLKNAKNGVYPL